MARRQGGRGRGRDRLDGRHVGGYGIRHARRLGVALAVVAAVCRAEPPGHGNRQSDALFVFDIRNSKNSLVSGGIMKYWLTKLDQKYFRPVRISCGSCMFRYGNCKGNGPIVANCMTVIIELLSLLTKSKQYNYIY